MGFIERAWRENWIIPPYGTSAGDMGRFRDQEVSIELHKLVARARRFERPLATFGVS